MRLRRIGLPAALVAAGLLVIVAAGALDTGLGMSLIAIAAIVVVTDAFARMTISSQDDRDLQQRTLTGRDGAQRPATQRPRRPLRSAVHMADRQRGAH